MRNLADSSMTTFDVEMLWAVRYRDGVIIKQHDGLLEKPFGVIDRTRICAAGWIPVPSHWNIRGFRYNPRLREFWIDVGADLYMRRRMEFWHMIEVKPRVQCYIIGDKHRRFALYPDGRILCQK